MLNLVFIEIISECDIFDTEIIRIEQPEIGELIVESRVCTCTRIDTRISCIWVGVINGTAFQVKFTWTGIIRESPSLLLIETNHCSSHTLYEHT